MLAFVDSPRPGLKAGFRLIKTLLRIALALPFVALLVRLGADLRYGTNWLGPDPEATLIHVSGEWAIYCLGLTLAARPLSRFAGLAPLLGWRRMLGLYAYFYLCCHLAAFFVLEHQADLTALLADVYKRLFLGYAFLAFVLLTALALTSFAAAQRRLGRNWRRLHRLVYLAGLLVVMHCLYGAKATALVYPLIYTVAYVVLMSSRLVAQQRR